MKRFLIADELCLRLDSNQHIHRKPPPQDGVSTNFTTQAKKIRKTYGRFSLVTRLGFEPRTHTLKVYCSTS